MDPDWVDVFTRENWDIPASHVRPCRSEGRKIKKTDRAASPKSFRVSTSQTNSWNHHLPWEPTTFIFKGYNPYVGGLKPSFFMVLGSKGRTLVGFQPECFFKVRSTVACWHRTSENLLLRVPSNPKYEWQAKRFRCCVKCSMYISRYSLYICHTEFKDRNHQSPRILNPEIFLETFSRKETALGSPRYSMCGVFTYIWVVSLRVNVSIHWASGICEANKTETYLPRLPTMHGEVVSNQHNHLGD